LINSQMNSMEFLGTLKYNNNGLGNPVPLLLYILFNYYYKIALKD